MDEAAAARSSREHAERFNAAVESGDFGPLVELFADDAVLEFVGVPAGPFVGRDAIAAAYAAQPPDDALDVPRGLRGSGRDVRRAVRVAARRHRDDARSRSRSGRIARLVVALRLAALAVGSKRSFASPESGTRGRVAAREAGAADLVLRQPRRLLHARPARGSRGSSRRCAPASPRPSGAPRQARPRRPCRSRRSTARRPAATRSGRAPRPPRPRTASRTSARIVFPRTIESSTITTRRPAISSSGLNLSLIPWRRSSWSGSMNVRPT